MATTERTVYDSRGYKPNFIRGIVRNPMIAVNTTSAAPQFGKIKDAITNDHKAIKGYYEAIVRSEDVEEQTRYQNQFTWELARHSIGEELVLYPAFEKYLKDGKEVADKDRREHEGIKQQLKHFQDLKATDENFISTLNSLMDDFNRHSEEEETSDLPKLQSLISEEENQYLTQQFDRTKLFVPSRAHPGSPNKPPFENVHGLLTAPVDKLMDILRKWPEDWSRVYNPPVTKQGV